MKRFLIVRACAIGDFVLNLPALRALAEHHSEARFTLIGNPETLELARRFIPVDAIHSIEGAPWRRLFYERVDGLQTLGIDAAFVWMKDAAFAGNLRASGIAAVHHRMAFPASGHAAAHLLETVALSAPELPDFWRSGSPRAILHPGSGSPKKSWPHFRELAEAIPGAAVLIGPCESDFDCPATVERIERLSLSAVADALCACRQFVGNDSGITHLAAYLGCPTLALFGPTEPRVWGPVGRRANILWRPSLEEISVKDVLERIEPLEA
jgi:ADP-heptose:LPS heptosyltransferase